MLYGEYQHSLDAKGRVNFPAKLRESLGGQFMLARGLGSRCLFVYSMEEWEKITKKIDQQPLSKAMALQRFLCSGAILAEPDKQGRILIPNHLRQRAKLEKEVVVAGIFNRVEIWNAQRWAELEEEAFSSGSLEQAMEEMGL